MENFLIVLLVKVLDPIGFAPILIASFFVGRSAWALYLIAIFVAFGMETFITSTNPVLNWGVSIIPGIMGSIFHAFICKLIFRKSSARSKNSTLNSHDFNEADFNTWYAAVKKRAASIEGSAVVETNGLNILDLIDDAPAIEAYKDQLSIEDYAQMLAEHFKMPPP